MLIIREINRGRKLTNNLESTEAGTLHDEHNWRHQGREGVI